MVELGDLTAEGTEGGAFLRVSGEPAWGVLSGMKTTSLALLGVALVAAPLAAQQHRPAPHQPAQHEPRPHAQPQAHHPQGQHAQPGQAHGQHAQHASTDSGFAAVQRRGAQVMGVDQTTSRHVFEDLPDGGRIELVRLVDDTAGVAQIRAHLRETAGQFARGDFTAPFLTHATSVPGTEVMAGRRGAIRYEVRDLPRGAEIRIVTSDAEALAAVRAFLAFQRADHRAGAH